MKPRRAFVIAHYDAQRRVALHLVELVKHLASLSADVVFVSTSLAQEQAHVLPPQIRVIVRPNVGYDFWSYKVGIESLGDLSRFDELIILNSSFVADDPARLCRAWEQAAGDRDLLGLTYSRAVHYHLQSYWISFHGAAVIGSHAFRHWWASIEQVSDKDEVIGRYELGMSAHFQAAGFKLGTVHVPDRDARAVALARAIECGVVRVHAPPTGPFCFDLDRADTLDPTLFGWDALYENLGIVKLKLFTGNSWGINTAGLERVMRERPRLGQLIHDALVPQQVGQPG